MHHVRSLLKNDPDFILPSLKEATIVLSVVIKTFFRNRRPLFSSKKFMFNLFSGTGQMPWQCSAISEYP